MSIEDGIKKELENRDEIIKQEIENSGNTLGGLIGKAKRIRKEAKKIITYTDILNKEELALFNEDYYLAGLILEKNRLDKEITEHIDKTIALFRSAKQSMAVENNGEKVASK